MGPLQWHDRSFDRDFTEWRADGSGRWRLGLGDGETHAELGSRWDFDRTSGPSASLVPSRNAGGPWIALERSPLFGLEWRAGYSFTARAYPDSVERDHFEHGWEGRARHDLGGAGWIELETNGERRVSIYAAPTTRDRYVNATAALSCRLRLSDAFSSQTRIEGEWFRYDQPDSALYFDYDQWRGSFAVRCDRLGRFLITAGPRLDRLRSPLNPAESYDEESGALELEWLGLGSWWNLAPAAGWRNYLLEPTGHPFEDVGIHSSYWFVDLGLFADQPVGRGWRVSASGMAHDEQHRDSSQNARSLYFSLDIRRLF